LLFDYIVQQYNLSISNIFYFLFTIVMKVLISCTEKPMFFIEVLDQLELFIDKKVIFDENFFSVGPPSAVRRPPSAVCRLPSAACRPPSAVRRLPSAVCRLPSAVCCPPSAVRRPPFAICQQIL
jgi:hypothetical protein